MEKLTKKTMLVAVVILTFVACASKRSLEIGDPTLTSPEERQRYLTIHDAFTRHDTNGDGYLDRHEYDQLQVDPEIVRVRGSIAELSKSGPLLFEEIDEDDDEYITVNELTNVIQPLLPQRN